MNDIRFKNKIPEDITKWKKTNIKKFENPSAKQIFLVMNSIEKHILDGWFTVEGISTNKNSVKFVSHFINDYVRNYCGIDLKVFQFILNNPPVPIKPVFIVIARKNDYLYEKLHDFDTELENLFSIVFKTEKEIDFYTTKNPFIMKNHVNSILMNIFKNFGITREMMKEKGLKIL